MPEFEVRTEGRSYQCIVQRGILRDAANYIPSKAGKLFIVTNDEIWRLHGATLQHSFGDRPLHVLRPPAGEVNKRLYRVEELAEQMMTHGADRTSIVIGFGGGIITDIAGFLAAIFMRGVPVLQIPTTLLAQVDAAIGGKTGVNLATGKNLIGSFHQPLAVLIDPETISTLPEREFRAGLFEVVKCGVIRDPETFELMRTHSAEVLRADRSLVDSLIASAVRVKAEVVSADEKESGLRRILNFGHTIGHAIEAETEYVRFLHGEAVAWGMLAATELARLRGMLCDEDVHSIYATVKAYGPLPPADDLNVEHLLNRLASDKKTLQGKVHFVLPVRIGDVEIVSGIDPELIRQATTTALQNHLSQKQS